MKLTVLAPEKKIADRVDVSSVTLPGIEGQIQILDGHAEMIGSLETGMLSFVDASGKTRRAAISTGFFNVKNDELKVLAETFEYSDDIDFSRAKSAQKKAESALIDSELDRALFRKYELKLQRALIRQQIAGKHPPFDQ
jgi:F-type H+-transporting ATPase subunit epsilon